MKDRNISETVDFFIETMDKKKLKPDFLVRQTKLNRSTIDKFLDKNWKSSPLYGTAESVANAFGYELSEVLRREDKGTTVELTAEEHERYRKYKMLSPDKQKVLDEILESFYENLANSKSKNSD